MPFAGDRHQRSNGFMKIMNFTQHRCTQEQLEAGIIDCPEQYREKLCKLLTFDEIPGRELVWQRAAEIVQLFETIAVDLGFEYKSEADSLHPMIGGAPFLMRHLENAFYDANLKVHYAFSKRELVEQVQEGGSAWKVAIFRHAGFYEV